MIEYKILHVPTGAYVYPKNTFTSSRTTIEHLIRFLYAYELYPLEEGGHYTSLILETACKELWDLYKRDNYIPERKEFEIFVIQHKEIYDET